MKISNIYQAIWVWANCRPSDRPSVHCALSCAIGINGAADTLEALWFEIDKVIQATPRRERKELIALAAESKEETDKGWQSLRKEAIKRPPLYVQQRFKRRLRLKKISV
jgi:hypothetical protein